MTDASRLRGRAAAWALGGLALLVSHDAVYLVHAGPGQPLAALLRTAAHGYWGVASLLLLVLATAAAAAMAIRVGLLRRRARAIGAKAAPDRGAMGRFIRTWVVYAALVATAFALQENVEHWLAHGHAPGAGALLGPEHPLALPVIGIVAAIAAAVATVVGRAHGALVAGIAEALRRLARAPRRLAVRPPADLRFAPASVLSGRKAGRAPPLTHAL